MSVALTVKNVLVELYEYSNLFELAFRDLSTAELVRLWLFLHDFLDHELLFGFVLKLDLSLFVDSLQLITAD